MPVDMIHSFLSEIELDIKIERKVRHSKGILCVLQY